MAENNLDPEAIQKLKDIIDRAADSTNRYVSAQTLAEREQRRLADEARRLLDIEKKAINDLGKAAQSATKELFSTTQGAAKYNGAIDTFGSAMSDVAKEFPVFGQAISTAITALFSFSQAILKQTDLLMKNYQDMAKAGTGSAIQYKDLYKLGTNAGYAADNMEKWTGSFKSLGPNMVALGGTAAGAAKEFGKLTDRTGEHGKVLDKQIEHYRRLGYNQDDYMQAQADAVNQLVASGVSIADAKKRQGGLEAATSEYLDNLTKLSALTGESVENLKKQREQVVATTQLQAYLAEQSKKEAKLRALATEAEARGDKKAAEAYIKQADDLQKSGEATKSMLQAAEQHYGKGSPEFAAFQKLVASGVVQGKEGGALLAGNPQIQEMVKAVKEGRMTTAQFQEAMAKATDKAQERMGSALKFDATGSLAKAMGINVSAQVDTTRFRGGPGAEERDKQANEAIKGAADGAVDAQGALADASSKLSSSFTNLTQLMNPYLLALGSAGVGLGLFAAAAYKATAALGGPTGIKDIGKGILGKIKGLGAAEGAGEAAGEIAGGAGGAAGGAGKALETLGKPLSGAGGDGLGKLEKASGGGAGKAIGKFIEGIGEGLSAVGKMGPTVLLGAGYISGAIVIIGAGIAGASWLMGKGLKSLGESLTTFNKIDGSNLLKIGGGLIALGAGMAAIGAGSVVGGITNLVGTLLGGGKDPLETLTDRLLKIQKSGLDGGKFKQQADAINAFASALSSFKKAASGEGSKDAIDLLKQIDKAGVVGMGLLGLTALFKGASGGDDSQGLNDSIKGLKDSIDTLNNLIKPQLSEEDEIAANSEDAPLNKPGSPSVFMPKSGGGGAGPSSPNIGQPSRGLGETAPHAPAGSAAASPSGKEAAAGRSESGIKSEVLSKKAQLEKMLGKKLVVTSGYRSGVANHGTGDAIDLGLNSNNLSESERNQLFAAAINMGFTGLGAEYRATGGPHIHLDTSHSSLTGWGSDYTRRSLPQDSPYLAKLISDRKGGVRNMAMGGITNGISIAGEAGREAVVPLPGGRAIPVEFKQASGSKEVAGKFSGAGGGDMGKVMQDMSSSSREMINVIREGFREMNSKLDKSNQLQDKLVKYSM